MKGWYTKLFRPDIKSLKPNIIYPASFFTLFSVYKIFSFFDEEKTTNYEMHNDAPICSGHTDCKVCEEESNVVSVGKLDVVFLGESGVVLVEEPSI